MTAATAVQAAALSDAVGALADLLREQFLAEEERGHQARATAARALSAKLM